MKTLGVAPPNDAVLCSSHNNNTATWTPSASAFDRAANAMPTNNRNELAPNDKDF